MIRTTRTHVAAAVAVAALTALDAGAATGPRAFLKKPDEWFRGDEGRRITENVLSWQSAYGSWPKNMDTTAKRHEGDPAQIKGTFDNSATTDELRLLARAFRAAKDPRCEQAFLKGLDGILKAQYPSGGWPQIHPPPERSYHRHITFNDSCMVRLMNFLREVADDSGYAFVDAKRRAAARAAFDRGVDCILKCQVVVDGTPTVWCAQHDAQDLSPRPARAYELVSLSGLESAGILQLLMSLDRPDSNVVRAVDAGAAWFEAVKITGIRVESSDSDRLVVKDPQAPPLWARFYEIGSNRPFFCGRDGQKKYALAEIEKERRTGYAWYGDWGSDVAEAYRRWKTVHP